MMFLSKKYKDIFETSDKQIELAMYLLKLIAIRSALCDANIYMFVYFILIRWKYIY